jgi:hypothetical protein
MSNEAPPGLTWTKTFDVDISLRAGSIEQLRADFERAIVAVAVALEESKPIDVDEWVNRDRDGYEVPHLIQYSAGCGRIGVAGSPEDMARYEEFLGRPRRAPAPSTESACPK